MEGSREKNYTASVVGQKTNIHQEVHKTGGIMHKEALGTMLNNLDSYISLLLFHNRTPDYSLFMVIINTAYILVKNFKFLIYYIIYI